MRERWCWLAAVHSENKERKKSHSAAVVLSNLCREQSFSEVGGRCCGLGRLQ